MIISSKDILNDAKTNHYAIPAFNFENLEMAQAIIKVSSRLKVPVIMQTTPSTAKYIGLLTAANMIKGLSEEYSTNVVLHLDHGNTPSLLNKSIGAGYSSVMIDGSNLAYNDNVDITKEVKKAVPNDIQVEAELGKVGGKEDAKVLDDGPNYTDLYEAMDFVDKTKIDSLAIGVGTAHGVYKGIPIINYSLISKIANELTIPIVLHGASGLEDKTIKECIKRGINKVNFATELRMVFTKGVKEKLQCNDIFDPKKYLSEGREKVMEIVENKIKLCMGL